MMCGWTSTEVVNRCCLKYMLDFEEWELTLNHAEVEDRVARERRRLEAAGESRYDGEDGAAGDGGHGGGGDHYGEDDVHLVERRRCRSRREEESSGIRVCSSSSSRDVDYRERSSGGFVTPREDEAHEPPACGRGEDEQHEIDELCDRMDTLVLRENRASRGSRGASGEYIPHSPITPPAKKVLGGAGVSFVPEGVSSAFSSTFPDARTAKQNSRLLAAAVPKALPRSGR